MTAWNEHAGTENGNENEEARKQTLIVVDDEVLYIPELPGDNLDKTRLQHLRMFYHLLKLRRGLSETILSKNLVRIDWVKVEDGSGILGERLGTMNLGRKDGTLVARFHDPNLANDDRKLKTEEEKIKSSFETVQGNRVSIGIEFVRQYNRNALVGVVSIPSLASLIFAIIWMGWYLIREHEPILNPQVIVATAFTVSLYLVTAGTLGIAIIAYLDKTGSDDFVQWKDDVDKFAKGEGIRRKSIYIDQHGRLKSVLS
ncbi:hypothetical protein V491_02360 [Pseudogymnoascus sp. VKM F-3775]|nr:hypothetical protein V491_02360 [Pseudogymnoascus sp. VKM F-3775]